MYCCCRNKTAEVKQVSPVKPLPGLSEMRLVKRPSPKKKGKVLPGPPMKRKPVRPLNLASGIPDSLTDWSSLSQDGPDPDVAPLPPKPRIVPVIQQGTRGTQTDEKVTKKEIIIVTTTTKKKIQRVTRSTQTKTKKVRKPSHSPESDENIFVKIVGERAEDY